MSTSFWQFYWSDHPWKRRQDLDQALSEAPSPAQQTHTTITAQGTICDACAATP